VSPVHFFIASGLCLFMGLFFMFRAWRKNHHAILMHLSVIPMIVGVVFTTLAIAAGDSYWGERSIYLIVFYISFLGIILYQLSNRILNNEVRRDR